VRFGQRWASSVAAVVLKVMLLDSLVGSRKAGRFAKEEE
jgi:hypothetical protein